MKLPISSHLSSTDLVRNSDVAHNENEHPRFVFNFMTAFLA